MARLIANQHGVSKLKDLVNTALGFMVPHEIQHSLTGFRVPDVLAVCGGDAYQQAISALSQAINHPSDTMQHAVNEYLAVIQILWPHEKKVV